MTEKNNLPTYLSEHTPWEALTNPIWPATSLALRRNLAKYNFPPKLNETQLQQVRSLLAEVLIKNPELSNPSVLNSEAITPLDKEFLFEHFLCLEGFQNISTYQAFTVDQSSQFLSLINIGDHLQLHLLDYKGEIEKSYNRLSKIENAIGTNLDYAFSSKFGFLTADPENSGTGLILTNFLHLPALIHTGNLKETLDKQKSDEVVANGMEGNLEDLVGDMLILRNRYTLGLTEESILHLLQDTTSKLILSEQAMRNSIKTTNLADLKDQVSRSYGLLVHSYQLQTKEALGALSLIKLGLDLGWMEGITDTKINILFFKCRRAHLTYQLHEKKIEPQDLPRKRSEFLHQELQGLKLKI